MKKILPCLLSLMAAGASLSQSLPIAIDSQFEDWTATAPAYQDAAGDGNTIDLLRFEVTNDERYLFLRLEMANEIILTENNNLALYLDTDGDALTGKVLDGIGAELELDFGDREGRFYLGNSSFAIDLEDVQFRHQPTVSSEIFEMAIGRDVTLAGPNPLFPGSTVRVLFQAGTGDQMPDAGQTFTYQFDDTPTPAFVPVPLEKENPQHLRLLTWNTLSDGLDDSERAEHFRRVLAALEPDIVTFNECWDMTAGQVATFMNVALPLGNFQSWKSVKLDEGNVTVSRYPILQNWEIYPGRRLTASLIDLPDGNFEKDLLVVNGHLRCCSSGNFARQQEADAFAAFILDAKTPGGTIDLPEGTPFVLSGDLNLVGWRQQLTTLLTGDIQNTNAFGPGGPLDWDGTDLLDVIATQADERMAYTWRNDFSSFPPSRIDYHICSNSVMEVAKSFTLRTEAMPNGRLAAYGLQQFDTRSASDHLPKVTDFDLLAITAAVETAAEFFGIKISPNPANSILTARFNLTRPGDVIFSVKRPGGQLLRQWAANFPAGPQQWQAEIDDLPTGFYIFEMRTGDLVQAVRWVKI